MGRSAKDMLREMYEQWGVDTQEHIRDKELIGCDVCGKRLMSHGHQNNYQIVFRTCGDGPTVRALVCGDQCLMTLAVDGSHENTMLHLEDWQL